MHGSSWGRRAFRNVSAYCSQSTASGRPAAEEEEPPSSLHNDRLVDENLNRHDLTDVQTVVVVVDVVVVVLKNKAKYMMVN